MRSRSAMTLAAGRLAAALLAASVASACRPASPPPTVAGAGGVAIAQPVAAPAAGNETTMTAEGTTASGDRAPCYRVLPLDERRRTLECSNGDRFTIGHAADGKWYPETKVRAGLVPGYASPEEAGKALCRCS